MSCPVCGCSETMTGGNSGDVKCNRCYFILSSRTGNSSGSVNEYRAEKFCPDGSRHNFSNYDNNGVGRCTNCGRSNR